MSKPDSSNPSNSSNFGQRLDAAVRQLVVASLLVVAVGATAWIYVTRHLDESIRVAVQRHIQADLAGTTLVVTVRSARRVEGEGIEVRGVVLRDGARGEPVLEIEELELCCGTDLQDLINERIAIHQVVVRRPRLYVTRGVDGRYNLASLLRIRPSDGHRSHKVRIEDGTVVLADAGHTTARPLEFRQVCGEVQPATPEVYARLLAGEGAKDSGVSEAVSGPSGVAAGEQRRAMHVRLRSGGSYCDELRLDGLAEPSTGTLAVSGTLLGLRFSRELLDSLPPECGQRLTLLASLQGKSEVRFAARRPGADASWQFEVAGELTAGRWEDARLPSPVSDVESQFTLTDRGGAIQRLAGRCGDAVFEMSLSWQGYASDSPLRLVARTRKFDLNRAWVEMLPSDARTAWEKLTPLGTLDADLTLDFDGQRWRPDATVRCLDVGFAYHRFPYRLVGGRGVWEFREGVLRTTGFQAMARGRPVILDVEIQNPGPDFTGFVALNVERPVPFDEELLAALPGEPQRIVRSLQPRGEWTARGRFERHDPQSPSERSLDINIHRAAIQYTGFSYPLAGIQGQIRMRGDRWDIVDLTGNNDNAYVVARGGWTSTPHGPQDFRLDFEATEVSLEDELRNALSPAAQRLWSTLQPRGTIDYLTVGVRHPQGAPRWSVEVFAQKRPAAQNIDGRYVTIRPPWTPFPLDNLIGSVRYQDGRVEIESVRAEHGRTSLQASGVCQLNADGGWTAQFSRVCVDRLTLDRETLDGIPAPWGAALARLNWSGPINAEGAVQLAASSQARDPIQAQWDIRLDLENGSLRCGVPVEQIRGDVRLLGRGDSRSLLTQGELQIDSAICQGIQVTQIRGPFWLTPNRLVFGDAWAERRRTDQPPRQVTAQLFDGLVATDAIVSLGDETGFHLQADVRNVDLRRLSREALPKKRDIAGRAFAALQLEGTSRGLNTWRGGGKVTCRDADFYEVPVMVAMIKPLRPRGAEGMAFQLSDVDFRVDGDRVYFDRIDFKGDALTLKGSGEMTMNRIVDLQFYTLMGRDEIRLPLLAPVLDEASRQIMEVRVTGPLEDPVIDRKVVPVINEALQKMFPELNNRNAQRMPLFNRVPGANQLSP